LICYAKLGLKGQTEKSGISSGIGGGVISTWL
jgi:hypothetical protein